MSTSSEKVAMEGEDHHTRYVHADGASDVPLNRQISVMLTQQQFEQLYLQPQLKSSAQAQNIKTFGNPTAIGVVSFLLSYAPTSACLMGWHGTSAASALALMPSYYFISTIGLYLAAIMEWILGNTLPAVIFASFAGFWGSFALVNDPLYGIGTAIGKDPVVVGGGLGFYLLFWALYVYILTVAALRTNVVFVTILFFVANTFTFLAASYLSAASGYATAAANLTIAGGAMGFVACVAGFWLLTALLMSAGDIPIPVPLIDLSQMFKKGD